MGTLDFGEGQAVFDPTSFHLKSWALPRACLGLCIWEFFFLCQLSLALKITHTFCLLSSIFSCFVSEGFLWK